MKEIEYLIDAVETVRRHGKPEIASWLDNAVNQYITSPRRLTFDQALGFDSIQGVPSQRTRFQKDRRNHHLKLAYDDTDHYKRPSVRCDLLASAIRDFESRMYLNWKKAGGPPQKTSELRHNLFLAKETGQPIAFSGRALYRLFFDI